jgi:hypothetical protein
MSKMSGATINQMRHISKRIRLAILFVCIVVFGLAFTLIKDNVYQSRNLLETYVGGVCTCPPNPGDSIPIVNLYKSRGDDLESIKKKAKSNDCRNFGCAEAKEYRLYK